MTQMVIPAGTMIEIDPIHRVIVSFANQQEAQQFYDWLGWIVDAKESMSLSLSEFKEIKQ